MVSLYNIVAKITMTAMRYGCELVIDRVKREVRFRRHGAPSDPQSVMFGCLQGSRQGCMKEGQ
jgi:hypothetical protein